MLSRYGSESKAELSLAAARWRSRPALAFGLLDVEEDPQPGDLPHD
jgi:hypothetical protein